MERIRVGLHGMNGHQIHNRLKNHPDGEIEAVCMTEEAWKKLPGWEKIPRYDTLDAMLAGGGLDMVCLCSPRRADQERDAMLCLEAGCHVYAEKPAVLSEAGLDRVQPKRQNAEKNSTKLPIRCFMSPTGP